MTQNPVLTQAQCSPSGTNTFTVQVFWQIIQESTYFVAVIFDPQNNKVGQKVVGGAYGASTAMLNQVTLAANTSYTVAVAQSDASGNPTSSYSQPFNLLQVPLTNIATVNDLVSISVAATLPGIGSPTGMSVNLLDATNALLDSVTISGSSGVLVPSQPLNPATSYYLLLAPSANDGQSNGGDQRIDLQMIRPGISAISYDGTNMTVSSATTLPNGATLTGALYANDVQIEQKNGSNLTVSFALASASLDVSKHYGCTLRATSSSNSGPASSPVDAVVTPPAFESAYFVGGHIGGRWAVPPVTPVPTGAMLTALNNGAIAAPSKTTIGYRGDIDISTVAVATSLTLQANSVLGVAKGPPITVTLPFVAPQIASVASTLGTIIVTWTNGGSAPGYRLSLNDSTGASVGFVDTGALQGALSLPVNSGAAYSVTVQPYGIDNNGVVLSGPVSNAVAALLAVPVVTSTRYDGAQVSVNWSAPDEKNGITGYEAVLLHADTLAPTGYSATANAAATLCQIAAVLDNNARLVAAIRATGTNSRGQLSAAVAVLAVKPVIVETDASATSIHIAWTAPQDPAVTGYTVVISDGASPETHQTFETSGTVLDVPNTLSSGQVHVTVNAKGASATGQASAPAYLFGAKPSYYPQNAATYGLYLVRSAKNQPVATDIIFAFPNLFTSPPASLPSVGIFTLAANPSSTELPYKLTIPANSIAWSFDPVSRKTLADDFVRFLKTMEMPDGSTVLIRPGALVMVRQSIALGLPLLFSEQLKFMYGFDPNSATGGYVDLVPGMRLRVDTEMQQITPPNNNQAGYVPTGTATYDIHSYPQGSALNIGFDAFLSANGRPTVPSPLIQPNGGGGGVIDLYNAAGRQPYFRLLYPSSVYSPKYSGLVDQSTLPVVLGAATYNGLLAASDQYVAQGNFTGLSGVYPFYFRGRAILTPELSAVFNGQRHWLALGSTVENLIALAGSQPYGVSAAVGGFQMRRSVGGLTSNLTASSIATTAVVTNRVRLEYPTAVFAPTQFGYFGLPLFCGDDVLLDQED